MAKTVSAMTGAQMVNPNGVTAKIVRIARVGHRAGDVGQPDGERTPAAGVPEHHRDGDGEDQRDAQRQAGDLQVLAGQVEDAARAGSSSAGR